MKLRQAVHLSTPDLRQAAIARRVFSSARVALALLAVLSLLAGCGEEDLGAANPTSPSVPTLRPTFTPLAPTASAPTVAPTAISATETPAPAGTETPSSLPPTSVPTIPPATATPVPTGPAETKSPDYGMQAFLWWRPEVAQRDLELIRDAGFGWVKQEFAWREIEGLGKGRFDWSVTDRIVDQVQSVGGLKIIARLDNEPSWASGRQYPDPAGVIMSPPRDTQDFADLAFAVASRYRGRIAAYQIWNEPNLSREWGGQPPNPAAYVELLRVGYQAIKRADPNAIVISAGMAPTTRWDDVALPDTEFLRRMYNAGGRAYFDALGAHGAGYKAPPELDPGVVATDPNYYNVGDPNCPGPACRIYCFRHVEDLRQIMVENGDAAKRVVVLEFGWTMDERPNSPYRWHAVTEEQQADYLVGAYRYARENWQPWIAIMSLIYMPSIDWTQDDEQFWWSVAAPNYPQFLPFKSYRDLAAMEK